MYSKLDFSSLSGTSTYPEEVVHFKDLMIFLISCALTGVKSICPRDLLYRQCSNSLPLMSHVLNYQFVLGW
jgi:hypothetical protein